MDYGTAHPGLPGVYKLGFWYDTGQFFDQRYDAQGVPLADPNSTGAAATRRHNWSLYGVFDQMVWRPNPDSPQAVGIFARLMGAPGDRNVASFSVNGGVTLKAPLPGRDNDSFGVGFGVAKLSPGAIGFDQDNDRLNGPYPIRSSETFIEVTYQYQVAPWWIVQPDFQYVFTPGGGIPDPLRPGERVGNEAVVRPAHEHRLLTLSHGAPPHAQPCPAARRPAAGPGHRFCRERGARPGTQGLPGVHQAPRAADLDRDAQRRPEPIRGGRRAGLRRKIQKDDVLVTNFNNNGNLQGLGTTIVDWNPSTKTADVFATIPRHLPQCPGGIGLTTAMAVLKSGWVIVGSLPSQDGTTRDEGQWLPARARFAWQRGVRPDQPEHQRPLGKPGRDRQRRHGDAVRQQYRIRRRPPDGTTAVIYKANVLRLDLAIPETGRRGWSRKP